MAFMDPEKAISALQALQAGPAMRKFNDALGTTAEAVGYDAMVDVSVRIHQLHGAEQAERFLVKQGLIDNVVVPVVAGKHSA